eukprot:366254-Chlamydomonas_euryale.AAC.7
MINRFVAGRRPPPRQSSHVLKGSRQDRRAPLSLEASRRPAWRPAIPSCHTFGVVRVACAERLRRQRCSCAERPGSGSTVLPTAPSGRYSGVPTRLLPDPRCRARNASTAVLFTRGGAIGGSGCSDDRPESTPAATPAGQED